MENEVREVRTDEQDPGGGNRFAQRVCRLLSSRYMPVWVTLVAIALTLPSLRAGLFLDDYHAKLLMSGSDSPVRLLEHPLDMFVFFTGGAEQTLELRDFGFVPWWTHEGIRGGFCRPLASATHCLDYMLWPDSPALMHAQSLLWYGALVAAVAILYRRFINAMWVAGLAAIMFAIDDAHGMPAGFICNRNALMATFFGVMAIMAHHRWRSSSWRAGAVVSMLFLAASLLSAEAGISTCAYLAAYALFMDRAKSPRRFASLIPYAVVVVVWRILWSHLGYGLANAGGYVDPLSDPVRYIAAVRDRAPFLLLGQLAVPPAATWLFLDPAGLRLLWRTASMFIVASVILLVPLVRGSRTARFWLVGMLLSVLPICAAWPDDRLLTFVGIGAMPLVAQFFALVFAKAEPKLIFWRILALLLAVILVLSHLVIAPAALAVRSAYPVGPKQLLDKLLINRPFDTAVEVQDVVFVNPPVSFFIHASSLTWAGENWPVPRRLRVLTSSLFKPVSVHRPDTNTLVVRPSVGYYAWVLDGLWRTKRHPLRLGDSVELTGMTVEVTELTADGRPAEAKFTFSVPLEDPSLRLLQYRKGSYVPFHPPAVGQSVELPGENPFRNFEAVRWLTRPNANALRTD